MNDKKNRWRQKPKALWLSLANNLLQAKNNIDSFKNQKINYKKRFFSGCDIHTKQLNKPIRVVHLTDLHVGTITPIKIHEQAVKITNDLNPDVVVLTGDFICYKEKYLTTLTNVLFKLKGEKVAVLGNHDHWLGAAKVSNALKKAGVEVLQNESTVLKIKNQYLQIVGLDDAYTGHDDIKKATKDLQPNIATIGLSHIAEKADLLWQKQVPLVFSGHTHGGQITFAKLNEVFLGEVAGHKYIHGLYGDRIGKKALGAVYVSAGIGSSVMPLRVGDKGKREIAIFDIGAPIGSIKGDHGEKNPYEPSMKKLNEFVQKLKKTAKSSPDTAVKPKRVRPIYG